VRNVEAAREAANLVAQAAGLTLIALISGGASAHLTLPAAGLTVEHLAAMTRLLQRAGATIADLNCVRKHCEALKGGRLVRLSKAERLAAFILSDVIGDRLDVIGSGPTVPDPTTYARALDVLAKFGLVDAVPEIAAHLRRGAAGQIDETPKPGDPAFSRVTNTIIASNRLVVDAVAAAAGGLGFRIAALEHEVEGEAAELGAGLVRKALSLTELPACIILGGETTVTVGNKPGMGGPSQELALSAAIELSRAGQMLNAAVLTFSTDGRDGPTDAAGAFVDSDFVRRAHARGIDPSAALDAHNSYAVLDAMQALIRTPPTGTNLNHVAALLLYP
jgi:hydroxypyruvate reductase